MRMKTFWLAAVVMVLLLSSSSVLAGRMVSPRPEVGDFVPGELIVGFKPEATPEEIQAALASVGGNVTAKQNLPQSHLRRVKLPQGASLDEAIQTLKANSAVKYAHRNGIKWAHGRSPGDKGVQAQSSDPLLWAQWGYYDIGANWLTAPSGSAPIVAVIDTGVDYNHPDLAGKVIQGYDFVNADADPMDDYGHGTHVSGIIAANTNNAYGMAGISWNSKILAIKVLNSQGWGTDWDIALGVIYAANYPGVKVANMSLGGSGYSEAEYDAVYHLVVTKKKLLVASAGNSSSSDKNYPAGFADFPEFAGRVLAVAAHGTDWCKADFSTYGTWVSITAPGVDILSSVPPYLGYDGFSEWSGTSMAAPHVSGAAAVAWAKFPSYTNTQIANLLTTRTAWVPLLRDGTCWPNDGSTFQRLEVFHVVEPDHFEECTGTGLVGFALDAETGEPLAGAQVLTKQGTTVTGRDFVPYYGEVTILGDYPLDDGYGLFQVFMNTEATANHTMQIKKQGYAPLKFTGIQTEPCYGTYVGTIPVPPNKPYYWLVITWDPGFYDGFFDAWVDLYVNGLYYDSYFWMNPGTLNAYPWIKLLWDSDDVRDQLWGDLRAFSEAIRIKKLVSGGYYEFWVYDWYNDYYKYEPVWSSAGLKAYIFRWDAATSKVKLVETFTPPPGLGGYWWPVCAIQGNNVTPIVP